VVISFIGSATRMRSRNIRKLDRKVERLLGAERRHIRIVRLAVFAMAGEARRQAG